MELQDHENAGQFHLLGNESKVKPRHFQKMMIYNPEPMRLVLHFKNSPDVECVLTSCLGPSDPCG